MWRFDSEVLRVLLLGAAGTYSPSETGTPAFPFLPMKEMTRFLREYDRNNDNARAGISALGSATRSGPDFQP